MNRYSLLVATLMFAAGSFATAVREASAIELMSPGLAARLGLEEVWRRQMSVPAGADSIVDQQVMVHEQNPRVYVEVVGKAADGEDPPVLFRIPTDLVAADGQPIGKEEAERLARREIRRLKGRGVEAEITSRKVPRVQLYTLADNGAIDCRDAETGAPIWMTQIGKSRLHYGKMGIGEKFLSVTNGGNLEKVDVLTGEPISTEVMDSVPMYGAIHSGDYSLVPTIRNGIEGYPLDDTTKQPFMEIVAGLALHPPAKSPSSTKIAWATDRAYVYVMELAGEPSVLFRLDTDGIVSGRITAAAGDRFFFGSESGQVYAVKATRTGEVLWSQPYGEPFYQAAFLIKGMLLIPSAYGNLFAIDETNGQMAWNAPARNVREVLGAIENNVFVRMLSGSLGVIDVDTGKFVEIDDSMKPGRSLINEKTDRLYFVNSIGTVQCLRPIGKELPLVRRTTLPEEEQPAEAEKPKEQQPKEETKPADPFANPAADPFGGGNDPFGGGGNDPFGGGGEEKPMADPFGGDPFGN
jgi:outer membrane protein assembly factor BamB